MLGTTLNDHMHLEKLQQTALTHDQQQRLVLPVLVAAADVLEVDADEVADAEQALVEALSG